VALLTELANDLAYGVASIRYRRRQTEIEKALRKSQFILAKAQEISHVGNWAWNPRTNEISWSDEGFRIFGFEPAPSILTSGGTCHAFMKMTGQGPGVRVRGEGRLTGWAASTTAS